MQESCIQGRQIRASNSLTLLPRCHLKSTKKFQGSSFNACSKRTKKRHFSCYLCSRIHNKPNNNPVEVLIFKGMSDGIACACREKGILLDRRRELIDQHRGGEGEM